MILEYLENIIQLLAILAATIAVPAIIGNGMSEFAYSVLRDENVTTEGCWVFCRNSGSLSKTALNEEYFAKKRYAGVTFMALRWVDMIDSCYLTPVNFEYQQETFFADPENVIWIAYNKDGFALHGIRQKHLDKLKEWYVNTPIMFKIILLIVILQVVVNYRQNDIQPFIYTHF